MRRTLGRRLGAYGAEAHEVCFDTPIRRSEDRRRMRKIVTALVAIAAAISVPAPASADTLYLRGKVTLEDGSPPGKMVLIERACHGTSPTIVATAGKSGEYLWRAEGDSMGLDIFTMGVGECTLRAVLLGYRSTTIDLMDRSVLREPRLPVLVIAPKRPGTDVEFDSATAIPRAVRKAWTNAEKALRAGNWSQAEESTARGDGDRFQV